MVIAANWTIVHFPTSITSVPKIIHICAEAVRIRWTQMFWEMTGSHGSKIRGNVSPCVFYAVLLRHRVIPTDHPIRTSTFIERGNDRLSIHKAVSHCLVLLRSCCPKISAMIPEVLQQICAVMRIKGHGI